MFITLLDVTSQTHKAEHQLKTEANSNNFNTLQPFAGLIDTRRVPPIDNTTRAENIMPRTKISKTSASCSDVKTHNPPGMNESVLLLPFGFLQPLVLATGLYETANEIHCRELFGYTSSIVMFML